MFDNFFQSGATEKTQTVILTTPQIQEQTIDLSFGNEKEDDSDLVQEDFRLKSSDGKEEEINDLFKLGGSNRRLSLGLGKLDHIIELGDPKQIPKDPSRNLWL